VTRDEGVNDSQPEYWMEFASCCGKSSPSNIVATTLNVLISDGDGIGGWVIEGVGWVDPRSADNDLVVLNELLLLDLS
jgi:hypothetical protein